MKASDKEWLAAMLLVLQGVTMLSGGILTANAPSTALGLLGSGLGIGLRWYETARDTAASDGVLLKEYLGSWRDRHSFRVANPDLLTLVLMLLAGLAALDALAWTRMASIWVYTWTGLAVGATGAVASVLLGRAGLRRSSWAIGALAAAALVLAHVLALPYLRAAFGMGY